jgi:transcriptional coactivator HFI1/ADA1
MPDIDPAALSRPSIGLSTPIMSNKSIIVQTSSSQKVPKTSQIVPARIDLEPLYTALKSTITSEQWAIYTSTISQFLVGALCRRPSIVIPHVKPQS